MQPIDIRCIARVKIGEKKKKKKKTAPDKTKAV